MIVALSLTGLTAAWGQGRLCLDLETYHIGNGNFTLQGQFRQVVADVTQITRQQVRVGNAARRDGPYGTPGCAGCRLRINGRRTEVVEGRLRVHRRDSQFGAGCHRANRHLQGSTDV